MRLERDDTGPFLTVGFDRVEGLRDALLQAGIDFTEQAPEGCTGPVYAVLRFAQDVDDVALEQALRRSGCP